MSVGGATASSGSPLFEQSFVHGKSQDRKDGGTKTGTEPERGSFQLRLRHVPVDNGREEFVLYSLEEVRVQQVLTQAECTPVAGTEAA